MRQEFGFSPSPVVSSLSSRGDIKEGLVFLLFLCLLTREPVIFSGVFWRNVMGKSRLPVSISRPVSTRRLDHRPNLRGSGVSVWSGALYILKKIKGSSFESSCVSRCWKTAVGSGDWKRAINQDKLLSSAVRSVSCWARITVSGGRLLGTG